MTNTHLGRKLTGSVHSWLTSYVIAEQATSHFLNQWWPSSTKHICVTWPQLFADHTNLCCSGKDFEAIEIEIYADLTVISSWLKIDKLSLNIKKTHYMVFTRKKFLHQLNIRIDGHSIYEVHRTKFLVVFIDNKFDLRKHMSYMVRNIFKG